jgi:hypothetical protein
MTGVGRLPPTVQPERVPFSKLPLPSREAVTVTVAEAVRPPSVAPTCPPPGLLPVNVVEPPALVDRVPGAVVDQLVAPRFAAFPY